MLDLDRNWEGEENNTGLSASNKPERISNTKCMDLDEIQYNLQ
jgi:hypothetical protein